MAYTTSQMIMFHDKVMNDLDTAREEAIDQMKKTLDWHFKHVAEIKQSSPSHQALKQPTQKIYVAKSSTSESIEPIRAPYSTEALNQATAAEHVVWKKQADLYSNQAGFSCLIQASSNTANYLPSLPTSINRKH